MSDILSASRNELIELVYELYDKVQALEAENAHLRELLVRKGDSKVRGIPYLNLLNLTSG